MDIIIKNLNVTIKKKQKIYIAGHRGMVGSAVWRALEKKGYRNLIGRSSKELDLKKYSIFLSEFYYDLF
mgnify:CR=1 FL=1